MKTKLATIIVTTAMLGANAVLANDPVPYPDIGIGGGKIDGKGNVTGDASSVSDSSGTTKANSKTQDKASTRSSSKVKVEGKAVSTSDYVKPDPGSN